MSFMEKIKQIVNVDEDNYYDNDAVEEDYEEYDDYDTGREEEAEAPVVPLREPRAEANPNRVVRINNASSLQVVLVKPDRFDAVTEIADHVNGKRTVVLNLESANRETSRRLLDFLSGVAYANGGAINPLANNTYIIVPFNVEFTGDLADELESNGVFF